MALKTTSFKPKPSVIKSDQEAADLVARQSKYHASINDVSGLRLVIHTTGRKVWESNIKHPISGKTESKTHGVFPAISLATAVKLHQKFYVLIRSGDDPALVSVQQKRRHQAHDILKTPIIQLGQELVKTKLERKELNNDYNDLWALEKLEAAIGKASFLEFDEKLCNKISKLYPNTTNGWTKRDKVKKQVSKIYNSLASDVRGELRMDIPHLLRQELGTVHQRNRADRHIPSNELTAFWVRLMTAPVPEVHKDFLVLALLTGERKEALLSVKLHQIQMKVGKPLVLYTDGKRTDGKSEPSPNLIPITPMIGLLLKRLINQSKRVGSNYLFPGQKGNTSAHLTDVSKPLLKWIGSFGNGVSASPHNLRRTISHEAAVAIGDIPLADAHITHSQKHFTGSRVNYFSPEALEYCEARRPTYDKAHQRIDDLILSNTSVSQRDGFLNKNNDSYTPGDTLGALNGEADGETSLYPPVFEECDRDQVVSPLASFCKGTEVKISINKRPLFQKALHRDGLEQFIEEIDQLNFEKHIT